MMPSWFLGLKPFPTHRVFIRDASFLYCTPWGSEVLKTPDALRKRWLQNPFTALDLVLDTRTFQYVLDTLPSMRPWERRALVKNRLEHQVPKGGVRGVRFYCGENVGYAQESVDFSSWESLWGASGFPFSSVTSVPLELGTLFPWETLGTQKQWTLFLYENSEGLTTHSLVFQNRLIFARKLLAFQNSPETIVSSEHRKDQNHSQDLITTLRYAERFSFSSQEGSLVTLGKLSHPLPERILGLPVHTLNPTTPFEDLFLSCYAREQSPSGENLQSRNHQKPRKKISFSLTSQALMRGKRLFWLPLWLKRIMVLYSFCVLMVVGGSVLVALKTKEHKKILDKNLYTLQGQISYYTKTHQTFIENLKLLQIYERALQERLDPLALLKSVAIQKPSSLILSAFQWHGMPSMASTLTFRVRKGGPPNKNSAENTLQALDFFFKNLRRIFPESSLGRQKERGTVTDCSVLIQDSCDAEISREAIEEIFTLKFPPCFVSSAHDMSSAHDTRGKFQANCGTDTPSK